MLANEYEVMYVKHRKDGRVEFDRMSKEWLTASEAEFMSRIPEVASVKCLRTEGRLVSIYIDGLLMQYNPVSREIVGKHAKFDRHNGWPS